MYARNIMFVRDLTNTNDELWIVAFVVLETAENDKAKGDEILRDLPRVKKSMTQLIKDLDNVQKLFYYK